MKELDDLLKAMADLSSLAGQDRELLDDIRAQVDDIEQAVKSLRQAVSDAQTRNVRLSSFLDQNSAFLRDINDDID